MNYPSNETRENNLFPVSMAAGFPPTRPGSFSWPIFPSSVSIPPTLHPPFPSHSHPLFLLYPLFFSVPLVHISSLLPSLVSHCFLLGHILLLHLTVSAGKPNAVRVELRQESSNADRARMHALLLREGEACIRARRSAGGLFAPAGTSYGLIIYPYLKYFKYIIRYN